MRDHRPFYFDPRLLQKIRLRDDQGELTLGHENPQAAWRIAKPLDLRTDSTVVKSLIEGLYQLEAPKISSRSAITLPGAETTKTQHRVVSLFHGVVILLDPSIQVGAAAVFHFGTKDLADRARIRIVAITGLLGAEPSL